MAELNQSIIQDAQNNLPLLKLKIIDGPHHRKTNDAILTCQDQNGQRKLVVIKKYDSKNASLNPCKSNYLMQYEFSTTFPSCGSSVWIYDAQGTLKDILQGSDKKKDRNNNQSDAFLSEKQFLTIAANLSLAVEDCHENNETNLQLYPENIYQAKNEQLKLDSFSETSKPTSNIKTRKENDLKALKSLLLSMICGPGQDIDKKNDSSFDACKYSCKDEIKLIFQKLCKTELVASYPAEAFCKLYIEQHLIELDTIVPQKNNNSEKCVPFLCPKQDSKQQNEIASNGRDQANGNLKQKKLQQYFSLCLPEYLEHQLTRSQGLPSEIEKKFFPKADGFFESVGIKFPYKTFEEWIFKGYAFEHKDSKGISYVCLLVDEQFLQNRLKTMGVIVYDSLPQIDQQDGINYIIYDSELKKLAKEISSWDKERK